MNCKDGEGDDRAGDLSRDQKIFGFTEEDSDKAIREKLRDWAHQYSKGEIHQSTAISTSVQNVDEAPEPQSLTPQISDRIAFRRFNLSDYARKDPEKRLSRPSKHLRRSSSHKTDLESPNTTRPVPQDPNTPPVPPIPEKWRAEWEWQQLTKRAERRGEVYPSFIPGWKTTFPTGKPLGTPEVAHPDPKPQEATRKEASRRANERRRKAFDAVVLEDQHDLGEGKGKENTRLRDRAKSGDKLFVRPDVRLPRSPGMINLAQEKSSPSPDTMWPQTRPRVACIEQDFLNSEQNFDEVEEPDTVDRPVKT